MTLILDTLRRPELELLASIEGFSLDSIAGAELPDFLGGWEILVVTDHRTLRIWSDVEEHDFEGFKEQYSRLFVAQSDEGLEEATQKGNRYYFHSGERIDRIDLIRDTVRAEVMGFPTWEYVSDVAIVFSLSGGSLAIRREHMNLEVISASFSDTARTAEIPSPTSYFTDTIDTQHSFERLAIPIATLLRAAD